MCFLAVANGTVLADVARSVWTPTASSRAAQGSRGGWRGSGMGQGWAKHGRDVEGKWAGLVCDEGGLGSSGTH